MADLNNSNDVDFGTVFDFAQDISQQEAPPPLPPKTYVGEITGAVAKKSTKGNVYIEVEWTIQPDQFPLDYAATQKDPAKLYYRRLVVTPDSDRNRYALRKFSEAIRAPANKRIDINDWIGKVANLGVKSTKYMGEDRAEISSVEMV
jgi:hypothetical protein